MDTWEFAIYKYSDERYDPEEWMFPGAGYVDGTIKGAMKAGLEAYPSSPAPARGAYQPVEIRCRILAP
jgi:hypothetical protein